jgi:hypothetical protein
MEMFTTQTMNWYQLSRRRLVRHRELFMRERFRGFAEDTAGPTAAEIAASPGAIYAVAAIPLLPTLGLVDQRLPWWKESP